MAKKNKFVGTFVNEMYAILIGIGIGSVIFNDDFDITNIQDTAMVLFITAVVLVYWWDWSEYIEDEVYSTKRELVIDFGILLTLEMLFAFFNNPLNLAITFIVLGFFDLIWVLNFIVEAKLEKKGKEINVKRWLFEKFFCITIYSVSLILFLFAYSHPIAQNVTIVVGFIIARSVGFLQVRMQGEKDEKDKELAEQKNEDLEKKIVNYDLLPATLEDASIIEEISYSYLDFNERIGFLLGGSSREYILETIKTYPERFFVVKNKKKKVVGYIEITNYIQDEILEKVHWELKELKDEVLSGEYLYIKQVAVKKENLRQGIGKFIFKAILDKYSDKTFTSFVAIKPRNNIASVKFHYALDFIRAGIYKDLEFIGLKNYESILFVKKQN